MGGEQKKHIWYCSLIYLEQDKDDLLKTHNYITYRSTFSLNRAFEFYLIPHAISRYVYVTSGVYSYVLSQHKVLPVICKGVPRYKTAPRLPMAPSIQQMHIK